RMSIGRATADRELPLPLALLYSPPPGLRRRQSPMGQARRARHRRVHGRIDGTAAAGFIVPPIGGLALAWIATTGLAYAAIRTREIGLHREWMIRNYVVTFGFVFFRLWLDPLMSLGIATPPPPPERGSWVVWG